MNPTPSPVVSSPVAGITPFRPGIAQGEGIELSQFVTDVHQMTGSVSMPWYPFPLGPAPTVYPSLAPLIAAIKLALSLGLSVEIPLHLDNNPANQVIPWTNAEAYLSAVKALAVAVAAAVPSSERARVSITVGNEISPPDAGDNPASWALAVKLFDLWEQAIGTVRNACPGVKAGAPLPFDSGPAYLKSALVNITPAMVGAVNADYWVSHYPFENGIAELPGQDVATILDDAGILFRRLVIGEFVWNLGTPETTRQTLEYCASREVSCFAWQWKGDAAALVNQPLQLKVLGFASVASPVGPSVGTAVGVLPLTRHPI